MVHRPGKPGVKRGETRAKAELQVEGKQRIGCREKLRACRMLAGTDEMH